MMPQEVVLELLKQLKNEPSTIPENLPERPAIVYQHKTRDLGLLCDVPGVPMKVDPTRVLDFNDLEIPKDNQNELPIYRGKDGNVYMAEPIGNPGTHIAVRLEGYPSYIDEQTILDERVETFSSPRIYTLTPEEASLPQGSYFSIRFREGMRECDLLYDIFSGRWKAYIEPYEGWTTMAWVVGCPFEEPLQEYGCTI